METIGFIGNGFVNGAVINSFKNFFKIEIFDILLEKRTVNSIKELMTKTKIIFMAVPTPIDQNGNCYLNHIYEIYDDLNKFSDNHIIVLKSSVPPGTTNELNIKYNNIKTVFNPEFLREKTYLEDFKNQKYIILGGKSPEIDLIEKIYFKVFPYIPIYKTDTNSAEMTKFFINVFLATKVSLCNELYDICSKLNIDYDTVKNLTLLDERIGSSHTKVPGDPTTDAPHGRGFGLSCFPINISILIDLSNKLGLDSKILKAVKERNEKIDRPEKDWLVDGKTIIRK